MPTPTEIRFARSQSRHASTSVLILVQLKLLQRLGYFPMLANVPPVVIDHVRAAPRAPALSRATSQALRCLWHTLAASEVATRVRKNAPASAEAITAATAPSRKAKW